MCPFFNLISAGIAQGFADGVGTKAQFNQPNMAIKDPQTGIIFVSDHLNQRIRMIDPLSNAVTTIAGDGAGGDNNGRCPTCTDGMICLHRL